jgi:hypothetical protein
MNALYHIGIIEGFLGQHPQLPRNVQDAIEYLKEANASRTVEPVQPIKKKRKPRLTAEQRQKQLAQLAKMREKVQANREARKAA